MSGIKRQAAGVNVVCGLEEMMGGDKEGWRDGEQVEASFSKRVASTVG